MLRGSKKLRVLNESSGDEDVRLKRIDTCNARKKIFSRGTRLEDVNSGSSSAVTSGKRRNKLPINTSDDSSSSEVENILQKTKRGSLRPLSDYDSGENSGERSSGMSTRSTTSGAARRGSNTRYSLTAESSDSSSDFNVTRSGRKRHFNIVSSSDSSDSGMPITFRRRSKRMRLESTSSDSSIDHPLSNESFPVMNQPARRNTSWRPTVNATVTSRALRQESAAGRRMPPTHRSNDNRPNNTRRINNNSQAATTGTRRSVNTSIVRTNTQHVNRRSSLRSTSNSTLQGNLNSDFITQSQRTDNITRLGSNNSTSRTNNRRPVGPTRHQNNPVTSRNLQVRPSLRVNRWNITDTNAGMFNIFDTSSNDSNYFRPISPSAILSNNLFPLSSPSSSSPSSITDSTSSSDEMTTLRYRTRRNIQSRAIIESDEENDVPVQEPESEGRDRNSLSSNTVSRPRADVEKKSNKNEKEHSSDSEGESDKCPICLAGFKTQEIGTPKICDHSFCLVCLQEWAKNNNTCPVDRKLFNSIVVRTEVQGQPVREIAVETPGLFIEAGGFWTSVAFHLGFSSEGDDSSISSLISDGDGPEETCCVCHLSNRSDFMIVCDFCYNVFHLDCVNPPLEYVPADDWNCPWCVSVELESYNDSASDSDFTV